MQLHKAGFSHAKKLIKEGKVDRESQWKLTRKERKKLPPEMFLGKDGSEFKFPYGKKGKVYRRGVIAAKTRAAQHGYTEIEDAAAELLDMIDANKDVKNELILHGIVGLDINAVDVINKYKEKQFDVIRINSPGGYVVDGYALYNYFMDKDVDVVIDGWCGSVATVIACAASKVSIPENGIYMIHNPAGGAFGESKDLLKEAEVLDKIKDGIVKIYSAKTGIDSDKISQMMDDETWLSGRDAFKLGFVDEVIPEASYQMNFDLSGLGFNKVQMPEQALSVVGFSKELEKRTRRNSMKEIFLEKASVLNIEGAAEMDEMELVTRVLKAYDEKLQAFDIASRVAKLKERVGDDFAMLFGKISAKVDEADLEQLVAKVEKLQKIVNELGEQHADDNGSSDTNGIDDVVMKKVHEIMEAEGLKESEALVELAKREPELVARWQ